MKLIDGVAQKKWVVVTGSAGSGKSMFMKYLTICSFEARSGVIPLFIELRHLNSLTDRNLLTFVRVNSASKSGGVTAEQFNLALKSGAFMLILDGFDELNYEVRDNIQKQILALPLEFPETPVVISSRPDARFGSWSKFWVFQVNPLEKRQVVKLIRGLEYDPGVKRRFLAEVNRSLFGSHKSFLASPLLATIMLLTYEEFAEVPDKMHIFYGQAFDTLFQKHDAQKEQYKRKLYTELPRDEFKACFAAFSAMSYLEEKFSFGDEELETTAAKALQYVVKAAEITRTDISPKQLIDDLRESVCMLQQDGLETVFVHRSFQEYFAALFVRGLQGESVKKILDKCAMRLEDSVVILARDMNRLAVERDWVLPAIRELERLFEFPNASGSTGVRYSKVLRSIASLSAILCAGHN